MSLTQLQIDYLKAIDANGGVIAWTRLLPDSLQEMRDSLNDHFAARDGLIEMGLIIPDANPGRPVLLRETPEGREIARKGD